MRLINVDALKADYGMAEDCKDCKTGYRSCEYDRIYSKMDFCGWIDDAPTVDVVPVVHGHWIEDPDGWECQCSECGHLSSCRTVYCSACGARMYGDGNE